MNVSHNSFTFHIFTNTQTKYNNNNDKINKNNNDLLTICFPKGFDYLIVHQKYDGTDQNRRQYAPRNEMEIRC